jgi:hypothetical protein
LAPPWEGPVEVVSASSVAPRPRSANLPAGEIGEDIGIATVIAGMVTVATAFIATVTVTTVTVTTVTVITVTVITVITVTAVTVTVAIVAVALWRPLMRATLVRQDRAADVRRLTGGHAKRFRDGSGVGALIAADQMMVVASRAILRGGVVVVAGQ